jgi:hypothetical protein
MGRLYVSQTRTDRAFAKVALRGGCYDGWGSGLSGFGLLSSIRLGFQSTRLVSAATEAASFILKGGDNVGN